MANANPSPLLTYPHTFWRVERDVVDDAGRHILGVALSRKLGSLEAAKGELGRVAHEHPAAYIAQRTILVDPRRFGNG